MVRQMVAGDGVMPGPGLGVLEVSDRVTRGNRVARDGVVPQLQGDRGRGGRIVDSVTATGRAVQNLGPDATNQSVIAQTAIQTVSPEARNKRVIARIAKKRVVTAIALQPIGQMVPGKQVMPRAAFHILKVQDRVTRGRHVTKDGVVAQAHSHCRGGRGVIQRVAPPGRTVEVIRTDTADQSVIPQPPDQAIRVVAAIQGVMATIAIQRIGPAKPEDVVVPAAAKHDICRSISGDRVVACPTYGVLDHHAVGNGETAVKSSDIRYKATAAFFDLQGRGAQFDHGVAGTIVADFVLARDIPYREIAAIFAGHQIDVIPGRSCRIAAIHALQRSNIDRRQASGGPIGDDRFRQCPKRPRLPPTVVTHHGKDLLV